MKYIIENIKIGKPKSQINSVYMKQKMESTSHECRHLKGIQYADFQQGHQTVSMPVCKQCGKILDLSEMEKRKKLLTKFKK